MWLWLLAGLSRERLATGGGGGGRRAAQKEGAERREGTRSPAGIPCPQLHRWPPAAACGLAVCTVPTRGAAGGRGLAMTRIVRAQGGGGGDEVTPSGSATAGHAAVGPLLAGHAASSAGWVNSRERRGAAAGAGRRQAASSSLGLTWKRFVGGSHGWRPPAAASKSQEWATTGRNGRVSWTMS